MSKSSYRSEKSEITRLRKGNRYLIIKEYIKKKPIPKREKKRTDPILSVRSSSHPSNFYFRREIHFIQKVNELFPEGWLLPRLEFIDEKNLRIGMEYLKGPTYRDYLIETISQGKNIIPKIKDISSLIAEFHSGINKHKKEILKAVCWNKTQGIRFRNLPEKRTLLWHYLRTIIYAVSSEFEEEYKGRRRTRGGANNALKEYLSKKEIDSWDFTFDFVKRHVEILYNQKPTEHIEKKGKKQRRAYYYKKETIENLLEENKLNIIHGDLGPQHIFKEGRIIDFDEVRLGALETDLVSALYNIYVNTKEDETELRLFEISLDYLKKSLTKEPTEKEKANFLARLVEARLLGYIRLFAVECKYTPEQIKLFTKGHPDYEGLEGKELKQTLLQRTFVDGFQHFLSFYQRGGGWESGLAKSDYASLVYQQLSSIELLLRSTGVFHDLGNPETIKKMERLITKK